MGRNHLCHQLCSARNEKRKKVSLLRLEGRTTKRTRNPWFFRAKGVGYLDPGKTSFQAKTKSVRGLGGELNLERNQRRSFCVTLPQLSEELASSEQPLESSSTKRKLKTRGHTSKKDITQPQNQHNNGRKKKRKGGDARKVLGDSHLER